MNGARSWHRVFGLSALLGGLMPLVTEAQDAPALEPPTLTTSAATAPATPEALQAQAATLADSSLPQIPALPPVDNRPVRPASEGPLHEAFLSPPKDREPE